MTSLVKKTALGFRLSSKRRVSLYGTFGLRLWRELRKRLHRHSRKFVIKDSREFAWGLLFRLGSRTRAAFETSKLLRSNKTADEEVYALIKLSRNIENPHWGRVVKFRKTMHWPRTSRPLGVLPLSSDRFMSECEQWLKKLILQYKYLFPSFHVPRNSLRAAPHPSIKKFLHNFQVWEETMWDPDFQVESVPCPWSEASLEPPTTKASPPARSMRASCASFMHWCTHLRIRGSRQNRPDLGPLQHPQCIDSNAYCSRSCNPQACHI